MLQQGDSLEIRETGSQPDSPVKHLALQPISFCRPEAKERKQVIRGCGERSPAARLQICFCGRLFLSSARILQESWISEGFCPQRISLYRKKALFHESITLIQLCEVDAPCKIREKTCLAFACKWPVGEQTVFFKIFLLIGFRNRKVW